MATDLNINSISEKFQNRNSYSFEYLSPSSLPLFLASELSTAWSDSYPSVQLTNWAPKEESKSSGITFRLIRRVPGKGRVDNLKPSIKKDTKYGIEKGNTYKYNTQYQNVLYEFTIFAQDYTLVNELTDAFEDFLFTIQGELIRKGVEDFLFEEEVSENFLEQKGNKSEEFYRRVLRYSTHVKKRYCMYYSVLSRITLKTGVNFKEIKDQKVLKSDKYIVDVLELNIPDYVKTLTYVGKKPSVDIETEIELAVSQSNYALADEIVAQNVFFQDKDYILVNYFDSNIESNVTAIKWLNNDGSVSPDPSTEYYVSWVQSNGSLTTTKIN